MREPVCKHCGRYFGHNGKGYKWSKIKYRGGWLCERCFDPYVASMKRKAQNEKNMYLHFRRKDPDYLEKGRINQAEYYWANPEKYRLMRRKKYWEEKMNKKCQAN